MAKLEANYLDRKVSLFKKAFAISNPEQIKLIDVLNQIKNGLYKKEIDRLRKSDNKDVRNTIKKSLKAFTLSAHCKSRKEDIEIEKKLINHTGILQIDLDKLQDDELENARDILLKDPYILFCFISPSGNGLKAGIKIDGSNHLNSFLEAAHYFKTNYNLEIDNSTKDVFRLCFVSYDPNLFINEDSLLLEAPKNEIKIEKKTSNDEKKTVKVYDKNVEKFAIRAKKTIQDGILNSSDGTRHEARLKYSILAGGYIAGGILKEEEILKTIMDASDLVSNKGETDRIEKQTILYGIEKGKLHPISKEQKQAELNSYIEKLTDGKKTKKEIQEKDFQEDNIVIDPETGEIIDLSKEVKPKKQEKTDKTQNFEANENDYQNPDNYRKNYKKTSKKTIQIPKMNELNFGDEFVRLFEDELFYINEIGSWYYYNGKIYKEDTLGYVYNKAVKFLYEIERLCFEESMEVALKIISTKFKKTSFLENVLKHSRKAANISTEMKEFDIENDLLILQNGIIDFKTWQFLEHSPNYKITKCLDYNYDKNANCPKFMKFINEILMYDQEMISYMQQIIGYSLTGDISEQCVFFLHGNGKNGKSILMEVLRHLLGPYYVKAANDMFISRKDDADQTSKEIMELQGARLVVSNELPQNRSFNESLLKDLTSAEILKGRRLYQNSISFYPTHKLWIQGNHLPNVRGNDEGIWRRLHLIPFEYSIPPEKQIPAAELIKDLCSELPGILNWAIEGEKIRRDLGKLQKPKKVEAASQTYREEQDDMGTFLNECCEVDNTAITPAKDLHKVYSDWCKENNEYPVKSKTFNNAMEQRGYKKILGNGNSRQIQGLKLKDEYNKHKIRYENPSGWVNN